MKLGYLLAPFKSNASAAKPAPVKHIAVQQLGIRKIVIVRTKSNGGMA